MRARTTLTRGMARVAAVGLALGGVGAVNVGAAAASIQHPDVVSTNPANFTPHVVDGNVNAFAQIGTTMYAGGVIGTVRNSSQTTTYSRTNLMAFSATTGAVSSWAPAANGEVWALAPSADGKSLYIGGSFTTIGGLARRGIARYDLVNNQVDPTFNAGFASGAVFDAKVVGGRLLVGGSFPKKFSALNLTTGANTGYLDAVTVSGTVAANAGAVRVYRFAVNPAGTRVVIIGNFTTVGGQTRRHAAMINLGTPPAVSGWYSTKFDQQCFDSLPAYTRDVDFSPDGTWFGIATTGGGYVNDPSRLCDSASKWMTTDVVSNPVWVNYSGGDSLHSIAITGAAVYVGGHQRWMDNPGGSDFAGPGAVERPGIAALDPTTGKALPWNPTRSREVGAKELYATPAGLWVGSDGDRFGKEYHEGIGFAPLP